MIYSDVSIWGGCICLKDDESEHEAFVPFGNLAWWTVDWTVDNGQIRIAARDGSHFLVTFNEGDSGEACSEALELLATGKKFEPIRTKGDRG